MDKLIENPDLNKDEWYSKTKEHWENCESTIKGVLGGNDQVHLIDVKASSELIEGLIFSKKIILFMFFRAVRKILLNILLRTGNGRGSFQEMCFWSDCLFGDR